MGILSSAVSLTRYKVEGKLDKPALETIARGLKENAISEIDEDAAEKACGWTSIHNPYQPDFSNSSFVFGNYLVFSLRLDKKSISPKLLKKRFMIESARRLEHSGRNYLSPNEKQLIKDQVSHDLSIKIPATPNVYDIIWNYEESQLWYFSNLKAANEELETLFIRSFKLTLIRLFPYTIAARMSEFTDQQKDALGDLSPNPFIE
jgi:hypothetical protein